MKDRVIPATVTPRYAESVKRNKEYKVSFNGINADVLQGSLAAFSHVICDGKIDVEVTYFEPVNPEKTLILPKSRSIPLKIDNNIIRFTLETDSDISLFVNNGRFCEMPLFIFANRFEEKPDPNDPKVKFFKSGQVYNTEILTINSGETVYIEEGAVVRGSIHAYDAENVKIMGRGILDGSIFDKKVRNELSIMLDSCRNFLIKDVTVIDMSNWIVVLGNCADGRVKKIREIGSNVNSDGCDICGCSNIIIEELFITNNDDCIVFKALDNKFPWPRRSTQWTDDTDNILIQKCVFLNNGAGQVFEFGHELRANYIKNVVMKDIDVIAKHKQGPVFGIHNRGYVEISNITFEDIRVEHCFDRLFDIRIMKPLHDDIHTGIGSLKNILFKDIAIDYLPVNDGYTISVVGGRDENHKAENITFQNVTVNNELVTKPEQIELHTKYCENLTIIP